MRTGPVAVRHLVFLSLVIALVVYVSFYFYVMKFKAHPLEKPSGGLTKSYYRPGSKLEYYALLPVHWIVKTISPSGPGLLYNFSWD